VFFLSAQTLDKKSLLFACFIAIQAKAAWGVFFLDSFCVGVFEKEKYHGLDVYLAIKYFTLLH